jgi:type VI secretion system protein ImpC
MSDPVKNPIDFTFNVGTQNSTDDEVNKKQGDAALCISILGDFGGRKNNHLSTGIEQRIFKEIDSYDYDDVLAAFEINLHLTMAGQDNVIEVPIRKFKDFHPDQLYKNVTVFSKLRDLRLRLQNNSTFDDAAQEIQGWLVAEDTQEEKASGQINEEQVEKKEELPGEDLLSSILEETENKTQQTKNLSLVDGFIKQLMANRVKVSTNPRKDEMLAAVDESITESMRAVLHHPDFQAVESAWQALRFLVRRTKSGKKIKIYLLDITKDELNQDLSSENIEQSGLYKLYCNSAYGDIDWRYIVGDFRFDADIDDMLLLSQLGYVAMQSGATFISSADEKLIGCESFSKTPDMNHWDYDTEESITQAWSLLRKSDVAKHVSLALPSFLIREPYSSISNPIKSFTFEETLPPVQHKQYLWANAAFLIIEQLAKAFIKNGWDMQPGDVVSTEDLPLLTYEDKGNTVVKPCAEIALTEAGAVDIKQHGIIPLCSIKNRDRIYSGEFFTLYDD